MAIPYKLQAIKNVDVMTGEHKPFDQFTLN